MLVQLAYKSLFFHFGLTFAKLIYQAKRLIIKCFNFIAEHEMKKCPILLKVLQTKKWWKTW